MMQQIKEIEELLEQAKQQVIKSQISSIYKKNFYTNEAIWHISLAQSMLRKVESNETGSDTESPAAHQT